MPYWTEKLSKLNALQDIPPPSFELPVHLSGEPGVDGRVDVIERMGRPPPE